MALKSKKNNKKNASSACWRVIAGVFSLLHVEYVEYFALPILPFCELVIYKIKNLKIKNKKNHKS